MDNFLEAERNVIGGLLLENSKLAEVDLTPADFCDETCAMAYRAILLLDAERQPFDVFTVGNELTRLTGRDFLGWLASVWKNTPSAANIVAYATHVRRFRRHRDARLIAKTLHESVGKDEGAIDAAIASLMDLNEVRTKTTYWMREAVVQAFDHVEKANAAQSHLTGIRTGLSDLDEILGGYQKSDLVVIGARPAMGKTGLLLSSALSVGVPALIQSAEMSAFQLGMRALSTQGRIDSQRLRTASLDDDDWANLTSAAIQLRDTPIVIDDKSSPTIGEVQRLARKMKQVGGIKILFVDYLQRLRGNNPRDSRIDQVSEIARGLKSIARELDIPVVALAQVNREVEKRTDKRPMMGDLANSSEIEKEADVIIMLYRDEVYNPDTDDQGIAEITLEKNRHGPLGTVRAGWIAPHMKFVDLVAGGGR